MGWFSGVKGSDGDYSHHDKHDSIPKGLIPRLAKAEADAHKDADRAELQRLAAQDRQRNKAARDGRN
jgi:hypothetical protein